MRAKSHIVKWGASLAVHIPKPIVEQWGVHDGSGIEMGSHRNQVVMHRRTYSLDDMLARITADNLHSESDTGPVQGNEEW